MQTFQSQLSLSGNRPAGFDYLRLILALSIIVWHSVLICYGPAAEIYFWSGPPRPAIGCLLPAFFALSGFLVAGSLERNALPEFLTLRIVRIFPALTVEVFLSAILLGPLLTTVGWREYFSNPEFFYYLLNVFGNIHYFLPGVFADNPTPSYVNAQLWSVPIELGCYVTLAIASICRMTTQKYRLFLTTLAVVMVLTFLPQLGFSELPPFGPNGKLLIISFLFGVAHYAMRCEIKYCWPLFALSIVAYWVLFLNQSFVYLSALPLSYATIFLGLQNPPRSKPIRGADYSYGAYLYGFPLQQTVCYLFPSTRVWYVNALSGVALALIAGYLSWTFVESKVIGRRKFAVGFVALQVERLARAGRRLRAATPSADCSRAR
jgi:peptidoglycan/LPS O-acetylase OafA/YrhL